MGLTNPTTIRHINAITRLQSFQKGLNNQTNDMIFNIDSRAKKSMERGVKYKRQQPEKNLGPIHNNINSIILKLKNKVKDSRV